MPPLDPHSLEHLAGVHAQAWQGLLSSTASVATLPLRTLQHLTGWPDAPAPTPRERLAEAEQAVAVLREALAAEQAARRAEAEAAEARLAESRALIAELRGAFLQAEREAEARLALARQDQALGLYQTLEPLLTQLPLVRHAVFEGREVAIGDLLALLGPLDHAVDELGLVAIGQVGEEVPFDPQSHQITRGPMPADGEAVSVKHVGYRLGEQILRRARVSSKLSE